MKRQRERLQKWVSPIYSSSFSSSLSITKSRSNKMEGQNGKAQNSSKSEKRMLKYPLKMSKVALKKCVKSLKCFVLEPVLLG